MNEEEKKETTPLVGRGFHSVNEDGEIRNQGVVVEKIESGWYLVRLFDWLLGQPCSERLVNFAEMKSFIFYENCEQMRDAYDSGLAKNIALGFAKKKEI